MVWEDVKAAEEKPPVRFPNRELSESQSARVGVIFLMVLTIVMLIVVALGGWNMLVGAKGLHIGFMVVYGVYIGFVVNWSRGVLPTIASTAVILAIFALVAGPDWFVRDQAGYADSTLPPTFLGIVTLGIIPVQMLLVVVTMWGFNQKWNVEEEIKPGEPGGPPLHRNGDPTPATAG